MTKKFSLAEFARILDFSAQRVSDFVAEGMPATEARGKGKPRYVDLRQAVDWLIRRAEARIRTADGGESIEAAELRLRRAAADLAQVRALEAQNKVVDLDAVLALMDRAMTMVGSQLDALAGRLAGRVAAESDPSVCRKLLFDEARQIRSALAAEFEVMAQREAQADGKSENDL